MGVRTEKKKIANCQIRKTDSSLGKKWWGRGRKGVLFQIFIGIGVGEATERQLKEKEQTPKEPQKEKGILKKYISMKLKDKSTAGSNTW